MTTRINENQKEPSGSSAHRAPLPDGFCSAIARGGVPDAPRRRIEKPYRAVEDAGPYGGVPASPTPRADVTKRTAIVGGGVPDAPCRRIETPYRAVEDAGPYGRAAHNAPCQRNETPPGRRGRRPRRPVPTYRKALPGRRGRRPLRRCADVPDAPRRRLETSHRPQGAAWMDTQKNAQRLRRRPGITTIRKKAQLTSVKVLMKRPP